jgi:hypothetical protein
MGVGVMDMQRYYEQLVGCRIVGFRYERDDTLGDPFPIFTVQRGPQRIDLTLSMDEEGNGGGFGFIEEAK